MRRSFRAIALATLGLVLVASLAATARMLWIPVAGPMFKKGKKVYTTVKTSLVAPSGATATGTVKLDCNAGDDADRLIVKAAGLPSSAPCQIWFADAAGKHVGDPLEAAIDGDGNLHVTVYGDLCHFKECPMLVVTVRGYEVLRAELRSDRLPAVAPSGGAGTPARPEAAPSNEAHPTP